MSTENEFAFEKARRLQIGRRHERTFITFYQDVQKIMRGGRLLKEGFDSVSCNSRFRQGLKIIPLYDVYQKPTKSFVITLGAGTLSISLKEPGK
ncbi:hypothetical protein [Klebsiella quasipneumoniae]|uniref:hypothetical protein n=1 Tax=Klebsiella quasipneumoniae TaxID=1463165 RepID=UPI00161775FA|nr:hypothetical protein [Klebsiella quasipneumoniae]QNC78771.1 hypothetical protein F3137_09345 [Klebsiella quasipneumoniae]